MRSVAEIEKEIEAVQKELKDVHGEPTEVYARIVGYYRSVRNWNKGKKSEYSQRKQFALPIKKEPETAHTAPQAQEEQPLQQPKDIVRYELFTRGSCPKCPTVKQYMEFSGLEGTVISVDTEEGLNAAASKGVLATPTVIFYNQAKKEVSRAHNTAELDAILHAEQVAIA